MAVTPEILQKYLPNGLRGLITLRFSPALNTITDEKGTRLLGIADKQWQ